MPKFKPGHSGNPKGRPKGALGRYSLLREALGDDLPDLFDITKAYAMSGDMRAMKLLLERVAPVNTPEDPLVKVKGLDQAQTFNKKIEVILSAIGRGEIGPNIGTQLLTSVTNAQKAADLNYLIQRLEQQLASSQ